MSLVKIDSILKRVLAIGNKEQNQHYPPHIVTQHARTVTTFLLDRFVELYPGTKLIEHVGKPFLETKQIPVINGEILFPEGYRNLLGVSITVSKDFKNLCSGGSEFKNDPLARTPVQVERDKLRGKCISNAVTIVDQDEWDSKTMSKYKFPTYKKPIGCLFEGKGLRVCPYDIGSVELRYVREPKEYIYGYQQLPDDTYVFDPAVSVDFEWEQTAETYLFKGMSSLYSIYLRDSEMREWYAVLQKSGLL